MKDPKVSVIMPVYNSQYFVEEAIRSILSQSFDDFEFLIIDDCSTDDSAKVIKKFTDKRIRFFQNTENLGYIKSLNFLLAKSKGAFIVRQDNDDISLKNRILDQVTFLEKHSDYLICGSNCRVFGINNAISFLPISDSECRVYMIFNSPFYHPSVCFRRSVFTNYQLFYDKELMPVEDYDMWTQISKFGKMANLPSIGFKLRIHGNNTSTLNFDKQKKILLNLRENYLIENLQFKIDKGDNSLLNMITYSSLFTNSEISGIESLFLKIRDSNFSSSFLNSKDLDFWLLYFWTKVCFKGLGPKEFFIRLPKWFNSSLFDWFVLLRLTKRLFIHKLKYN